jgi:membrane fusion protein, multidrug efflux system
MKNITHNPTFFTNQNYKLKKSIFMKTIVRLFTLVVIMAVVTSCSDPNSLANKKKNLAELKSSQEKTLVEIKKLEIEIAKLDPKAVTTEKTRDVKILEITPSSFQHFVQIQGTVTAEDNIMVNAKNPGIVTKVFVREGDKVSKGQTLAQQDISVMLQSMAELKTSMSLTEDLYERRKALWEQKIGTEIDYILAKNQKESLERKLATLQSQIALSQITSPINGVVDVVNIKEGEVASPGMGVIRVVNLDRVKITAKVADNYLGSIKQGDKMDVRLPDLNKTISANISFVSRSVDAMSRTFVVEASVNQSNDLRPNQIAILQINDRTALNVITIDENLVQNTDNGTIVYAAEEVNNKLVASVRKVKLGQSYNGKVEILDGLKTGDKLIIFGYGDLVQDTPIAIEKSAAKAL